MANIIIKQVAAENRIKFCMGSTTVGRGLNSQVETARTLVNTSGYTQTWSGQLDLEGVDAAEEMFELTNDPSRRGERNTLCPGMRPVDVGDIVNVDGVDYVCLDMGWGVLA